MISNKFTEENPNDNGVSPVISVILMVALTIVLSAIIGTFVLDLAGDALNDPVQAAINFDHTYEDFYGVYIVDGVLVSAPSVDRIELRGDIGGTQSCEDASNEYLFNDSVDEVGNSATVCVDGSTGGDIRAVGYLDGSGQVLQTYSVPARGS